MAANNPFSWIIASGNLSHFQSYLIGLKSRTSHSLCLRQRKLKYHLFSIVHFAKDNLLSENNYPPFFFFYPDRSLVLFACFVRLFSSLRTHHPDKLLLSHRMVHRRHCNCNYRWSRRSDHYIPEGFHPHNLPWKIKYLQSVADRLHPYPVL